MRRLWATLGLLLGGGIGGVWGSPAAAQAPDAPVLTLPEALELAIRNNPGIRQARNSLDLNRPEVRGAVAAFLPNLRLDLGTHATLNRQTFALDPLGRPLENPQAEWVRSSSTNQWLRTDVVLFDGFDNVNRLRQARTQADLREAALEAQLLTLTLGVERSWLQALQQSALVEVEERLLETRRLELEVTRRLFGVASAGQVDVLGAELAVLQQERSVEQARGEALKALQALQTVLGESGAPRFRMPDHLPEPFDPAGLDPNALVERALLVSPRLRQQELQVAEARISMALARNPWWLPTVQLSGNWGRRSGARDWGGFLDLNPGGGGDGSFTLNVVFQDLPGLDRYQRARQLAAADVGLRNAQEGQRQARLEVEEQVRARVIDLQQAWGRLEGARRALELSERRAQLVGERYRLAQATFRDLEDVAEQVAQARRALTSEHFAFAGARIALEEAVGAPLPGGR